MLEGYGRGYAIERARVAGPFDEPNAFRGEVIIEDREVGGVGEAMQIQMSDSHGPVVEVADRERRTGDWLVDAERAAGSSDEGGFPTAELTGYQNDVSWLEALGELGPGSLRGSSAG